jgi:cytochrome c oxidase cbb3-type subunit 3
MRGAPTTCLALMALAVGCSQPSGPERELSGAKLYNQHCARCHGVDGKPVPEQAQARDLSDRRIVDTLRNDQIKRAIQMGRPPAMPAFGDRFTDAALEVLVAHVRGLSGSTGERARPGP